MKELIYANRMFVVEFDMVKIRDGKVGAGCADQPTAR